jgi:hypothetical protein
MLGSNALAVAHNASLLGDVQFWATILGAVTLLGAKDPHK